MANIYKPTPSDQKEVTLNKTIKLPRQRYGLRVKEETFAVSKQGNNMIVLTLEIVSPEFFTNPVDGSKVSIAGCELRKHYLTLNVKDDAKKSQNMFDNYSKLCDKLGKPIGEEGLDIDNPPKRFEGMIVDAICDGKEYVQRTDPTPEQKKNNELGDPIKDAKGKDIVAYSAELVEILGPADESVAASAATKPY